MDYKENALRYAEQHGIYEYRVQLKYMEYWSLYDEGFYFFRVDLDTNKRTTLGHIDWSPYKNYPIPTFLMNESGTTFYNYFCG